jgi:antitoxin ChpS
MQRINLRKVGGSVMLAVPPAILELLGLAAGATVGVRVEDRRLIVEASPRRRYSLDELVAQCEQPAAPSAEDRAWLDDEPVGSELL